MLLNLHKKNWTSGLILQDFNTHTEDNEASVKKMLNLSEAYNRSVLEESKMTAEQLLTRHVGKKDPKKHLEDSVQHSMTSNIVQVFLFFILKCLGSMLDAVSF
jgi:26S proteasome regulatory subunit N11